MIWSLGHYVSVQWLTVISDIASSRRFFVPIQFSVIEIFGFGSSVMDLRGRKRKRRESGDLLVKFGQNFVLKFKLNQIEVTEKEIQLSLNILKL